MEKLQEPITPCQLFGEQQLEVGRWEDGNAVYLTDYGGPILNSDEEQTAAAAAAVALRFQPQQQPFFTYDLHQKLQHQEVDKAAPNCCTGGAFYSSTILPCLEDDNNKMPFLQMLQSSSGLCYNPQQQIFNLDHFHQHQGFLQLLLELQEQETKQQQQHHLSPPPPEVVNHHHQQHYYYQAHDDYPSAVTTPTPKSSLLVSNGNHELVESCVTDEIMMELYSSTSPAKSSETTTTANKERQQLVKNPPPCRRDENLLSSSGCEQEKEEQKKGCLGRVRRTTPSSQCEMGKPPLVKERKKRKRSRPSKNKEEMESQRMTHIAVERNRRKQMNDHLNCLRSLMPPSYIQRGDQASIIGGAIDFVKELEQLLQSLQAQKRMRLYQHQHQHQQISEEQPVNNMGGGGGGGGERDFSIPTSSSSTPSASTPSSSTATTTQLHDPKSTPCTRVSEDDDDGSCRDVVKGESTTNNNNDNNVIRLLCNNVNDVDRSTAGDFLQWRRMEGDDDQLMTVAENSRSSPGEADVSVVVIHNHVNLKVQCTKRNGQLLKAILALEDVRLTVLHLNVTSWQSFVHYSFNLKVEDDAELRSAEEIAAAVHQIFNLINS